jgi:hypothetical protein
MSYWLPVIQSRYLNRFSFLESAKKLYDLIGDYPQIAIGTVCKCRKLDFIIYCCRVARKIFPKSWIHAFGLTLTALPKVAHLIDSYDSLAWTFPRTRGHSCKTLKERTEYFNLYINKTKEVAPNVRFYTFADVQRYPYWLCNRKNYKALFQRQFEHAIIDSGVMDFYNPNITDYPRSFLNEWKRKAEMLNLALKGKAWFVIPDYPDDYHPGQFGDNVTKTLQNIQTFLKPAIQEEAKNE